MEPILFLFFFFFTLKYYWHAYAFILPDKVYYLLVSRKENVLGF